MSILLGEFAGGVLTIAILTWLLYALAVRFLLPGPKGWAVAAGFAYILGVVLMGYSNADGGPWAPGRSVLFYAIAALIIGAVGHRNLTAKIQKSGDE